MCMYLCRLKGWLSLEAVVKLRWVRLICCMSRAWDRRVQDVESTIKVFLVVGIKLVLVTTTTTLTLIRDRG